MSRAGRTPRQLQNTRSSVHVAHSGAAASQPYWQQLRSTVEAHAKGARACHVSAPPDALHIAAGSHVCPSNAPKAASQRTRTTSATSRPIPERSRACAAPAVPLVARTSSWDTFLTLAKPYGNTYSSNRSDNRSTADNLLQPYSPPPRGSTLRRSPNAMFPRSPKPESYAPCGNPAVNPTVSQPSSPATQQFDTVRQPSACAVKDVRLCACHKKLESSCFRLGSMLVSLRLYCGSCAAGLPSR